MEWKDIIADIIAGGTLIVLVAAMLVSVVAIWVSYRTAERQRHTAERQWQTAKRQWQTAEHQRLTASAELLTTLSLSYDSTEMRKRRQRFAFQLLDINGRSNLDICESETTLDFFEEIGYLVHRGVLDKGMAWNHFSWDLDLYYQAVTDPVDLIKKAREEYHSPALYCETEWLHDQMKEFDAKANGKAYEPPTLEEVASFLIGERNLVMPEAKYPGGS